MKRFLFLAAILLFFASSVLAWLLLGSATAFNDDKYDLYIRTGMSYEQLLADLEKDTVVKSPAIFNWVARRMSYPENVKAGKYEIRKGMGTLEILRMLKNGRQVPVHLVITKIRTREHFASMVGRKFECDSASMEAFLLNNDSMRIYGLDSNTALTTLFPDTYSYFWNTTPSAIYRKIYAKYKAWWTPQRIGEARAEGLTPSSAYILASIVEEETNAQADKGKIASVYLNRLGKGMKLGADPTVKFALRDFELKRIYDKHTRVESPYNTYRVEGLPPGPICTPSEQTVTAVLEAPKTDYLYFVAKPGSSGYSNFAATFKEHKSFADAYRKWLDDQMAIKKKVDSAKTGKPPGK
jgi:UPF0755 protein